MANGLKWFNRDNFELIGIVCMIAMAVVYLERMESNIERTMARVKAAYEEEKSRDAAWLVKDTKERQEIMSLVKELRVELIQHLATSQDDMAYRAGLHAGAHENLDAMLNRVEGYLNQCIE